MSEATREPGLDVLVSESPGDEAIVSLSGGGAGGGGMRRLSLGSTVGRLTSEAMSGVPKVRLSI